MSNHNKSLAGDIPEAVMDLYCSEMHLLINCQAVE